MKKILHSLIVLTVLWAVYDVICGGPDALGSRGTMCFRYFTTDSNILAALGSLLYIIWGDKEKLLWLQRLRFAGTAAVTITLITVILFLGPVAASRGGMRAFLRFYEGNTFVLHLSAPIMSIAVFLMEKRGENLGKKDIVYGMLPVIVYSIVYLTMVVFVKAWPDWYGFTFGGQMHFVPVVMAVMYLAAAGVSLILLKKAKRSKN